MSPSPLSPPTNQTQDQCRPFFLRTMCTSCKTLAKPCIAGDMARFIPTRSLIQPRNTYPMIFEISTKCRFDIQLIGPALGNQIKAALEPWLKEDAEDGDGDTDVDASTDADAGNETDTTKTTDTDLWVRESRRQSREFGTKSRMSTCTTAPATLAAAVAANANANSEPASEPPTLTPLGLQISILVDFPSSYITTRTILPALPTKIIDEENGINVLFNEGDAWSARPALGPGLAKSDSDGSADGKNKGSPSPARQSYDSAYYRLEWFSELVNASGPCMIWSNLPLFEGSSVWGVEEQGKNFVFRP
ncbi:uncharacterized protein BDV17DRAFT_294431 [Aspergillus undulatus]|uniref:uncharacterized protein n=1 Tax=Aspergillus undulatus TaxID=1810928 RepID=UPI003CCD120B